MQGRELFRKGKKPTAAYEAPIDRAIMVVTPLSWLILVAGVLMVAGFLFWACCSWFTTSVSATGVYHPGASEKGEIVAFVPVSSGKVIEEGMSVAVYVSSYNQQEYGHMNATVTYVDSYVATVDEMRSLLGDDLMVQAFAQGGPVVGVICKLEENSQAKNGYSWTNARGEELTVNDGSFVSLSVAVSREHPIVIGVPALRSILAG